MYVCRVRGDLCADALHKQPGGGGHDGQDATIHVHGPGHPHCLHGH